MLNTNYNYLLTMNEERDESRKDVPEQNYVLRICATIKTKYK